MICCRWSPGAKPVSLTSDASHPSHLATCPKPALKVLCVIDNLGSGGAQRQFASISHGLKQRGHEVEVFVYYPEDHFRPMLVDGEVTVRLARKRSRFSVTPVLELRRLIKQGRFDRVLAFLETPCVYAELASVGRKSVRLVVSERSLSANASVRISKWLKAQLHRLADCVTTNSHAQREWMGCAFPWLKDRLRTIYNGVNLEVFRPGPALSSSGSLRLLGVGRISKPKNIIRLVQGLELCRRDGKHDIRVDWAGRVDAQEVYAEANASVARADLGEAWRWLGARQDVPELMRQYDALILPSLWEGLPNAVCESLASGLPVLASRVSDNPRLVQEAESGFLFDPSNPVEMASVLARFADLDRNTRNAMRKAARAFAERELPMERCVAAYERVLMGFPSE